MRYPRPPVVLGLAILLGCAASRDITRDANLKLLLEALSAQNT